MRLLVLADVHADATALEQVLDHADGAWDAAILLGDLIGYGSEPVATVAALRALAPIAQVRGNHEDMLARRIEGRPVAASRDVVAALDRHRAALTEDDLAWLLAPPERAQVERAGVAIDLVHGSPEPGGADVYLLGVPAARRAFPHLVSHLLLFGHTHVPGGFVEGAGKIRPVPARGGETVVDLTRGDRWMLNPGSVGRPRDRGPAGCYMLLDLKRDTATIRRLGALS